MPTSSDRSGGRRVTSRGGVLALLATAAAWLAVRVLSRSLRRVRGRSMAPRLRAGDLVLVVPTRRSPRRGEVVVARDPRQPSRVTVKRVVGVPGDVVDLGGLPAAVPPGHLALGGDDPAASTDSRHYGAVPIELVDGRAVARVWPAPGRLGARVPADPGRIGEVGRRAPRVT